MSIVPACDLSPAEMLSLGNNVLPAVARDRTHPRNHSRRSRRRRQWFRQHRRRAGAAAA